MYNIVLVSIAGLYLGSSMPLDALSGYAVGLICFSLVSLGFGSVFYPINLEKLNATLIKGGMKDLKLKPASVDARGSVPFFGTCTKGPVFVKVFYQDNNAADWLFKMLRRIQYRRLEDEVPSLTPKRTIEHEAYITMLAKSSAGVRVPQVIGVFRVAHNSYAMATELIISYGLDKIKSSEITDKMLSGVWKQINTLHQGRIIHKDLRCANIMIEKATKLPWIIDFGFSESAIDQKSFYKDNVEFIASSATKVGASRAVKIAVKELGKNAISDALPYMQYAALSGATTTDLKAKRGLLEEIRLQMSEVAGLNADQSKKAKLSRINRPSKFTSKK
jgi:tRNA A-37 threonylcarbamoyl transferase component Bud32